MLRGVGQTLITAGVIVLLFVVYEVYVTNYFAHRAAGPRCTDALEQQWAADEHEDPLLPLPGSRPDRVPDGRASPTSIIPRLGRDYGFAIVQGTSTRDLEKGPGHYRRPRCPGRSATSRSPGTGSARASRS